MARPPIDGTFFDGDDTDPEGVEPLQTVAFSGDNLVSEYLTVVHEEKSADPEDVASDD